MAEFTLNRASRDGEVIAQQEESGDCMFVIQEGRVSVVVANNGVATVLRTARVELQGWPR